MIPSLKMVGFVSLSTSFIFWGVVCSCGSVIALSVIIGLLLRVLYRTILYPEILTPLKKIPTPPGRSLLKGNNTPPSATSQAARLRYWSATVPNDGLIRYYQTGNQERLLVTSPKALSEILVSNAGDFVKPESLRQRLSYVTGNGLLLAEGEEHRAQRKGLMPAFSFRHIKDLYPAFWSKARELTKRLENEVDSNKSTGTNVIEVRRWATRTTLDIIGLAGMDHDFESLRDPNNSVQEASLYIRTLCRNIIQEKQEKLKIAPTKNDVDLIAVALKCTVFTDENLVDQMMTFLAAGHGTTSHALQWAVYALCKHNHIQTRLRQEIRDKLPSIGDLESTVSATDIDSLAYLNAFCNEVLRFHPPVPATVREALHETTVAGYQIPKGTTFTIAPGMINHDTELWGPDAGVFDPERWMREGCTNTGGVRSNYGFLTFLHGPRSCIGATFAKSELACLVAALVGRFRMELEDPDKEEELIKHEIGASPVDGVRTRFEIVDGW